MGKTELVFIHHRKDVEAVKEFEIAPAIPMRENVTESFRRCVVLYCSESAEFEVDGMKFRATCERIE